VQKDFFSGQSSFQVKRAAREREEKLQWRAGWACLHHCIANPLLLFFLLLMLLLCWNPRLLLILSVKPAERALWTLNKNEHWSIKIEHLVEKHPYGFSILATSSFLPFSVCAVFGVDSYLDRERFAHVKWILIELWVVMAGCLAPWGEWGCLLCPCVAFDWAGSREYRHPPVGIDE
jgi:hypothetical protein